MVHKLLGVHRQRRDAAGTEGQAPERPRIAERNRSDRPSLAGSLRGRFGYYRHSHPALDHPAHGLKPANAHPELERVASPGRMAGEVGLERAAVPQAYEGFVQHFPERDLASAGKSVTGWHHEDKRSFRTLQTSRTSGAATFGGKRHGCPGGTSMRRPVKPGTRRRSGG